KPRGRSISNQPYSPDRNRKKEKGLKLFFYVYVDWSCPVLWTSTGDARLPGVYGDDKAVQKRCCNGVQPAGNLRMKWRFTHRGVMRPLVPRVLHRLIGCLSTRFRSWLISLMNETKALILLGHPVSAVWITPALAGTMTAVFASPRSEERRVGKECRCGVAEVDGIRKG